MAGNGKAGEESRGGAKRAVSSRRKTRHAADPDSRRPGPTKAPFTVFLDRDGVFNVHPRVTVRSWQDFQWLPGVPEAFARLNRPDVQTCLCTNQPFVGLGMLPRRRLRAIHDHMVEGLEAEGGRLDHIEAAYAPIPVPSRRRKPNPGLLEDGAAWLAARGTPVDKSRAVMIGDKPKDAQAAQAFGIPAILLATTYDEATLRQRAAAAGVPEAAILDDLPAAVEWVLDRL